MPYLIITASNALHYTESITIKYLDKEVLSNELGNIIGF